MNTLQQITEIQNRFAQLPSELRDRVDCLLKQDSLELAAHLLFKAGEYFTPSDLDAYRRTLFPSTVPGPGCIPPTRDEPQQPLLSADAENTGELPVTVDPAPSGPDPQLHEARQRLVQLLAGRPDYSSADTLAASCSPPCPSVSSPPCSPCNSSLRHEDASVLLSDLRDLIKRHVILPDMAAETLALWVVHTYAFTLRQVTAYIGVVSPEKRCGKTTLLELLGFLAHEAIAAANISPPALFRIIEETRPTLIIDEADTFMQARDEMAGILNAGYRQSNAYVVRVAEGKDRKLVRFSCWCPKVMAAIGRLPDTLADRCIIITMQRKMSGEKCERLRELDVTEFRQRCADLVRAHSDVIARARPAIPLSLNDRAADIWEPLLAIADLAGGDWPQLARHAAEKLSGAYDDEVTLIGYFVKDLRNYMVLKGVDRILSRDLVAFFNPRHDRPWEDLRRGREINEYWLGHKMTGLGINSKSIRLGETVGKGYLLADVEAAFRRYVPSADLHSAQAATVAKQGATE